MKYKGLWLKRRNEEESVGRWKGSGTVMSPVSLSPSLPSSELILKSVTSRLSTSLSSTAAFPPSPSTPCNCNLLTLLGSADECSVMGPGYQDSQTHHFSYNLCTGAASAPRNVSLLCLQPHSSGLHPMPSSPSTSGSPESWQGQNTQRVSVCQWLGSLDCSGQCSSCLHLK